LLLTKNEHAVSEYKQEFVVSRSSKHSIPMLLTPETTPAVESFSNINAGPKALA